MNLSGLYILDGNEKISLDGDYSKDILINKMIDNWVYYMECHKCGKSDYCKYTEPHNVNPHKKAEIQCGVVRDFIRNYVNSTFDSIQSLTHEQKQAYLDSAYYLSQYVQSAEIGIGTLINEDYLTTWEKFTPALYGFTKTTLDFLNKAHKEMKHLEMFGSKRNLILVEGHSENIFVENFSDIKVLNYEGKGRIRYDKIELLVQQYKNDGYEVYLQTDKDGKPQNENVNKIINEGLIKEENIFQFKYDFETSIPLKLFYKILKDNELISDTFEVFKEDITLQRGIVYSVESKYDISINKRMVANEVSLAIHKLSRTRNLYQDEKFLSTEIGQFWNFISRII